MVLGVLSVVASSYQQMSIGMLNKAVEIRLWLSDDFDDGQEVPVSDITELREYVLNGKFPLRSSLSAQQLTRLPFALLGWAVYSFLTGFGLYLGFSWANHVVDTDQGKNDNRNVLIVFLVAALLSILMFAIWSIMKASEQIGGDTDRDPRRRRLHRSDVFKEVQKKLEPIKFFRNQQQAIPTVLPRRNRTLQDEKAHSDGIKPRHPTRGRRNPVDWTLAQGGMDESAESHPQTPATNLAAILEEAADAHRRCAEADMAVAAEYARLAARSTGNSSSQYGTS
jgi:hypothetical protein